MYLGNRSNKLMIIGKFLFTVSVLGFMISSALSGFFEGIMSYSIIFWTLAVIGFAFAIIGMVSEKLGLFKKRAGDIGEMKTAYQLQFIGNEYRVLNNLDVWIQNGMKQQFDHIVVGPNGVFHIDTKHYYGKLTFTDHGLKRETDGKSEDPTGQISRHEYIIKNLLQEHDLSSDIIGIINFSHPKSVLEGSSPAFLTVKLDRLLHTIQSYKPSKPLSKEEIQQIANVIQQNSKISPVNNKNRNVAVKYASGVIMIVATVIGLSLLTNRGGHESLLAGISEKNESTPSEQKVHTDKQAATISVNTQNTPMNTTNNQSIEQTNLNKEQPAVTQQSNTFFSEEIKANGEISFTIVNLVSKGEQTKFSVKILNNHKTSGPNYVKFPFGDIEVIDINGNKLILELPQDKEIPYGQNGIAGPYTAPVSLTDIREIHTEFWVFDPSVDSKLVFKGY